MKIKKSNLGPLEMRFFTWVQSKKCREVKTCDLVKALKLTPKQEADLLYNLSRQGLILKLWRGFYLVPARLPAGGKWTPSAYFIIKRYMNELGAGYQISGAVAFNFYGYSTQMASEFVIYNDKVSKKVEIMQYRFIFAKVNPSRLGATKEFQSYCEEESVVAVFSSQARMLLDAVSDYKRFGTLPEAYEWIIRAIIEKKVSTTEIIDVVCKYGNTSSKKRIGWVLEKIRPKSKNLNQIVKKIPKTKFLVPLLPNNFNGPINQKWGVIENVKIST